jgi:L-2-hydroxyglutarate oxidase LhgO
MGSDRACAIAVIGTGLVGLATARELLRRNPGLDRVVLEKERELASHQSGHNSGVVHSGLYYQSGSLRARLCRAGRQHLLAFAEEKGIPVRTSGKVVVAVNAAEVSRLTDLQRRAEINGLRGVESLTPSGIRDHESDVSGLAGLWIPETAVIDYPKVAAALATDVEAMGGEILKNRKVVAIHECRSEVVVHTVAGTVSARQLVSCAGLQSDRLARMMGLDPGVRVVPFRGDYFELAPLAAARIRGLVYPVPKPSLPFLGVHLTRGIGGHVTAGPNAVVTLDREGYGRVAFKGADAWATVSYGGFWLLAARNWRTAATEVWRDLSRSAYARTLRPYVPWIEASDLRFGPSGVRAQAVTTGGQLVDDFLIRTTPRTLHVLNAPSPAATACLAIAEHVADSVAIAFGLADPKSAASQVAAHTELRDLRKQQ